MSFHARDHGKGMPIQKDNSMQRAGPREGNGGNPPRNAQAPPRPLVATSCTQSLEMEATLSKRRRLSSSSFNRKPKCWRKRLGNARCQNHGDYWDSCLAFTREEEKALTSDGRQVEIRHCGLRKSAPVQPTI